jgi:hypothetical protein
VSRMEVETAAVLASAREDADGLVWIHARAREVSEKNARILSDVAATTESWWVVSERKRREHESLHPLLQTRGSELCLAILGPPRVRNHLSEGMRIAALCHTEMAGEPAALRAMVSSTMELMLRCSPDETFWVEVVGELMAKILWLNGLHS